MIIVTSHLKAFEDRKALSFKKILADSLEAQEVYIRRQFDCANTDATALAAIDVAEKLGFVELAENMKQAYEVAFKKEALS